MNDTHPISSYWLQYYQHATATDPVGSSGGGHSDTATSTIVTTSFTTNNISSPNNPTSISNNDHLNPQGPVAKPIRRRSRASRRTPTTLLNASTTNFRSLVQQFTGCHNIGKATSQKGPVNLSFGVGQNQNDHQIGTSSRIAPFDYYNQQRQQQQEQQRQWQVQQQNQEMYPKLVQPNVRSASSNLDDFNIDDVSIHELMDESGNTKDGYYF